jgi:hypothetical protein
MNKYQFYISFNNKPGTASSKAIDDCTAILSSQGYHNLNLNTNLNSKFYFLSIIVAVLKLLFKIRRDSLLAIQYPLLSGNKVFRYIIRLLRLKNVKFIAIIHDLNELRYKQSPEKKPHSDSILLNDYDYIIAHNCLMINWLKHKVVTTPMLPLEIFDYLSEQSVPLKNTINPFNRKIVFAGNLSKSVFIYNLDAIPNWHFNFYGPNIIESNLQNKPNLEWHGCFSATEILSSMNGSFGLIWDGFEINSLDEQDGNYLLFNNPHKLSLYLAAGLPVIVPLNSAVASFVINHQCGLALPALSNLVDLQISPDQYDLYQKNAFRIGEDLKKGVYLKKAILKAEAELLRNRS